MEDLIKALQIFLKYANEKYPTHCEHDVMMIGEIDRKDIISEEDIEKLDELGFFWSDEYGSFISYRYGSC